ncbi:MAG: efflux RND transporter permease subunit [Opitutales bacterium]|nr:efflux RND transporter permease subunit [Opitutales bacterium]
MMIDFAIMREASGMKPIDAVHEACMERFRPIIMTSFAALMGMLPIALGWGKADAESRIPLGVVVVGGLIFSQLVTLYVTPVIYLWFDWLQTHVLDKIPFFARGTIGISTEGDSSNEK